MSSVRTAVDGSSILRSVWGGGQLLAPSGLQGATDHQRGLVARTLPEGCALEFRVPFRATVRFSASTPRVVSFGGDFFALETPEGTVRGAFLDAHHLLIHGPCEVSGDAYAVHQSGQATLLGVPGPFDPTKIDADLDAIVDRRLRWFAGLPLPERIDEPTRQALYKACSMTRTQTYAPEGRIPTRWTTPDRWPHQDMWLWDSVFHAIGLRHFDWPLAREAIDAVFSVQHDDSFIPHRAWPGGQSDITQPPVLAFGVERLLEVRRDLDWVRGIYPKLISYLAWNEAHRDTDGNGLLEWFIEDDPRCRSGESGMDNSPRFDDAVQLDAVDFNAFMATEYRALSRFAEALGNADDAARFRAKWQGYCERINANLWNQTTGFYHDRDVKTGQPTPVLASSGFLPLLCGAPDAQQARRLVDHLCDPQTFGTALPVPSVALCSRRGGDKDMWRGPVWVNINWLIAHALHGYGYAEQADRLFSQTAQELVRQHARYGTFFEYYDDAAEIDPPDLDRKGPNNPGASPYHQVIHEFGWSATLFIDMIFRSRAGGSA